MIQGVVADEQISLLGIVLIDYSLIIYSDIKELYPRLFAGSCCIPTVDSICRRMPNYDTT